MEITSIRDRHQVLTSIKKSLTSSFHDKIISAIVYGSTLNQDFYKHSDYDILLIVKNPDINFLKSLKKIKSEFASKSVNIDFNVHSETDIPSVRGDVFWHNNRGLYVQKEFYLYGKVLLGKNVFSDVDIDQIKLFEESVRVINSLNYQARKLLINSDLSNGKKIQLFKWCIYGSLYVLATHGIYPSDRRKALMVFTKSFRPPIDPTYFLNLKLTNPVHIKDADIRKAYKFLTYLDELVFKDYLHAKSKG